MKRYKFSFYNPDSPIDPIGSFLDQFPIEDFPLEENIPIDSSSLPSEFEKEFQSIDPFKGPQAPIKSHWETSGTFSLSPTNSRHPKGHLGVDLRAPGGTSIYPFAPLITFSKSPPIRYFEYELCEIPSIEIINLSKPDSTVALAISSVK